MRVRYVPVPGRVMPYYTAWIMHDTASPLLIGFVSLGTNSWTATPRSGGNRPISGWPRRADAAEWLLLSGGFAQRRLKVAA